MRLSHLGYGSIVAQMHVAVSSCLDAVCGGGGDDSMSDTLECELCV